MSGCGDGCEVEQRLLLKGSEAAVLSALAFLPEKFSVSARCIMEPGEEQSRYGAVRVSSAAARIALLW